MANAWLVKPLSAISAASPTGTPGLGAPIYAFNDFAGVVWSAACDAAGNTATLRFDLGSDQLLDTLMVFGLERLPALGTVRVSYATAAQGYFTGGFGDTGAVAAYAGSALPASLRGVSLVDLGAVRTARYIQIEFAAGGAGEAVKLARIVVGKRIQLDRNFSFGAALGVKDLGKLDVSRRGVLLRSRGVKLRTTALTFSNIFKDEIEASVKPLLEQIGNTEIVALVTDPATHAQRQNRCYCGPFVGDLSMIWRNAAAWEAKAAVLSLF